MDIDKRTDIAIVGGGILGSSLAYFLSIESNAKTLLIEKEKQVAYHSSTRNTGKVHAPFIYDPLEKKFFARSAYLGFDMLKEYCKLRSLPFLIDGVLQVAVKETDIDKLHKYIKWGHQNGLEEKEILFLGEKDVKQLEPNVKCKSAIHCLREAAVNYGLITQNLVEDASRRDCKILLDNNIKDIIKVKDGTILKTSKYNIFTKYFVNVSGGNAIDMAHKMDLGEQYTDLHFRGDYWKAPLEYERLTKRSIYSVPTYPEYPFLDPHWIVKADGKCEIGPNAVLVSGPASYKFYNNARLFLPKLFEALRHRSIWNLFLDINFISLLLSEFNSSISKSAMISRVKKFLPRIDAKWFSEKGSSGIRSSVIDKDGKFVSQPIILNDERSMHILNYNSPGATGALPFAATIIFELYKKGIINRKNLPNDTDKNFNVDNIHKKWDIEEIYSKVYL